MVNLKLGAMDLSQISSKCLQECTGGSMLQYSATVMSGAFFGASWYINAAEHAARQEIAGGASAALDHFIATFMHAMYHQRRLALLSGLAGVGSYMMCKPSDSRLLIGGVTMLSIIPYTVIVVKPIYKQLLDVSTSKKQSDSWKRETLNSWNSAHKGRTILSGIAFLSFVCAIWCKK